MAAVSARQTSHISINTHNKDSNGISSTYGYFSSPDNSSQLRNVQQRLNGGSPVNTRASPISPAIRRSLFNSNDKNSAIQDTVTVLKKKSMSELGAGVSQSITDASFINLVEWIRSERLTTLPHKGSRWDKVLIRALYFAEQLHGFEKAAQDIAFDSTAVAQLGYGHARLLLQVTHPCPVCSTL
jgi:hypothetical protein